MNHQRTFSPEGVKPGEWRITKHRDHALSVTDLRAGFLTARQSLLLFTHGLASLAGSLIALLRCPG